MSVLTADDLAGRHRYLATARPQWENSMATIRNLGGPWECPQCSGASLLVYRCSVCGTELTGGAQS